LLDYHDLVADASASAYADASANANASLIMEGKDAPHGFVP